MAEEPLSEFNGSQVECVKKAKEIEKVMNLEEDLKTANEISFRDELIRLLRMENDLLRKEAGIKKKHIEKKNGSCGGKGEQSSPQPGHRKQTSFADIPNEVLDLIMRRYMDLGEVMAAGMSSRRLLSICRPVWRRKRAAEIEQTWSSGDYTPSPAEVTCASLLAAAGHLSRQIITTMADKIAESLRNPSPAELQCGAALATQGHITEVKMLYLNNLDISPVPAGDLSSLVQCVSGEVTVCKVTGGLSPVLSSVQSDRLFMYGISLSTADTQQLVAAMDTGVQRVMLDGDTTLDMGTLAQYDGKGECGQVELWGDTRWRYRNQVAEVAGYMGWRQEESNVRITITRSPHPAL